MSDIFKYEIRRSKNEDEKGVSLNTKRKLEKIFIEWFKIIDEYCIRDKSDAPYYYNERASVSIFTGAIFRSGELAMEEFVCTKGAGGKSKNVKDGRADLWFTCGFDNFICEAKQKWLDSRNSLTSIMNDAKKSIDSTKIYFEDSIPLALTFWSPRIMNSNAEYEISKTLENLEKSFNDGIIDMYCLAAPKSSREFTNSDGVLCPYAVILGRFF